MLLLIASYRRGRSQRLFVRTHPSEDGYMKMECWLASATQKEVLGKYARPPLSHENSNTTIVKRLGNFRWYCSPTANALCIVPQSQGQPFRLLGHIQKPMRATPESFTVEGLLSFQRNYPPREALDDTLTRYRWHSFERYMHIASFDLSFEVVTSRKWSIKIS